MSSQRIDLISIPALRERPLQPDDWVWITPEERIALVVAVEALALLDGPMQWIAREYPAVLEAMERGEYRKLLNARRVVARFDFGEKT